MCQRYSDSFLKLSDTLLELEKAESSMQELAIGYHLNGLCKSSVYVRNMGMINDNRNSKVCILWGFGSRFLRSDGHDAELFP